MYINHKLEKVEKNNLNVTYEELVYENRGIDEEGNKSTQKRPFISERYKYIDK